MKRQVKLCAVAIISFIFILSFVLWLGFPSSRSSLTGAETSAFTTGAAMVSQVKVPEKITLHAGKKPGEINFSHKAHGAIAEKSGKGCVECHHTSTNAKLKTEKPPKCESCHLAKGNAKNPKVKGKEMWRQEAFHTKCQSCHKEQKKGPTKCMECHTKAA